MKSASWLHLACGPVHLCEKHLALAAQARRSGRLSCAKVASNVSSFKEKCSLCVGAWTDINLTSWSAWARGTMQHLLPVHGLPATLRTEV